jgi:hypothetical protein
MLTDALRTAYLAALYRFGPLPDTGPIELRVGQRNEALQAWLQGGKHHCATVLTAFNPGSERCSDERNAAAQHQLRDEAASRALCFIEGRNLDPAGHWPPEDSLLIAGLSLVDSHDMAHRFGQLAFLWSDTSAVPQLHLTMQRDTAQR